MEFEDVSPEVEWECKRVAAAFEIREWRLRQSEFEDECPMWTGYTEMGVLLEWAFHTVSELRIVLVNESEAIYQFWLTENEMKWEYERYLGPQAHHPELTARGPYRLGIEDEGVLAELNHPLSAHEKLELRLSMPREF